MSVSIWNEIWMKFYSSFQPHILDIEQNLFRVENCTQRLVPSHTAAGMTCGNRPICVYMPTVGSIGFLRGRPALSMTVVLAA